MRVFGIDPGSDRTGYGCVDSDGYTHDIQCVDYAGPDADYRGHLVKRSRADWPSMPIEVQDDYRRRFEQDDIAHAAEPIRKIGGGLVARSALTCRSTAGTR